MFLLLLPRVLLSHGTCVVQSIARLLWCGVLYLALLAGWRDVLGSDAFIHKWLVDPLSLFRPLLVVVLAFPRMPVVFGRLFKAAVQDVVGQRENARSFLSWGFGCISVHFCAFL